MPITVITLEGLEVFNSIWQDTNDFILINSIIDFISLKPQTLNNTRYQFMFSFKLHVTAYQLFDHMF